jgi:hypothetical protein
MEHRTRTNVERCVALAAMPMSRITESRSSSAKSTSKKSSRKAASIAKAAPNSTGQMPYSADKRNHTRRKKNEALHAMDG